MTYENDVLEPKTLCEVDPCCYVSYLFAGDSPISAAADSLSSWPCLVIPKIVHPGITSNNGEAVICQGSADRKVGWRIEINSRSMYPNYCDWFGVVLQRSEERSRIGDIIFGLNLDDSLCNLSCLLITSLGCQAALNRQRCTEHGKDGGKNRHLKPGFHMTWYHSSPVPPLLLFTEAGGVKFRSFVEPLLVGTCHRWPVVSISIAEFSP